MDKPTTPGQPKTLKKQPKQLNAYLKYSGLAFQMAAVICAGVFGGMQLDKWLNIKFPVFLLTLTLLAVGASLYLTIKGLTNNQE